MATRFQAASLVASPTHPTSVAWSDENLIAVACGHLVTILNPAQLLPRGLITISPSEPFPFGLIDRKDLSSGCLLSTCLSRDLRPCVRSISWSPIGLAPNAGCFLSVCTVEGRVKLYRMPYYEFSAEWVEVCDISELMYSYFSSVNFLEPDIETPAFFTEQENQPASDVRKQPKRRKKNALAVISEDSGNEDEYPSLRATSHKEILVAASKKIEHFPYSLLQEGSLVDMQPNNMNQLVPAPNSKARTQNKAPKGSTLPFITAEQYASRSAMLCSLVVAWSPIVQTSQIGPFSTYYSPNCCSVLAVGGKSGKISFWRIDKPQYFSVLSNKDPTSAILVGILQAHSAWITAMSWSLFASDISNSRLLLATGSSDGSVKIWLAYTGELLNSSEVNFTPFTLLKEVIPTNFVAVSVVTLKVFKKSPDKMHLAIGKGSGAFEVFICDLAASASNLNEIGSYEAHDHIITGLVWAFDGSCLYSCSQDNSVHSWSLFDNILSEVPIPLNPLGEKSTNDVPNVFDSCFGLAVSPGNMMIAVARSFDADSLNPMYQQRSQKAAVEFFWIGGQQIDTELEFEFEVLSGLSERELIYWNANLLWSLNQYEDVNKPLVVWDVLQALASFRQYAPQYVEQILGKWLISYMMSELELPIVETLSQASDLLPKMSSRQLHLLNIVIRRVILTELKSDTISLEQAGLKGLDDGEENLSLWLNLLFSSERELRERLLAFTFSAILSLASQTFGKTGSQYQPLVGVAQMEQWVALNRDDINDHLKVLNSDIRKLKRSKLQKICEYVPKEQCSFCSSLVPFESTEVGFCQGGNDREGVGQSHKLLRCAASMKVCPVTPSWFCICCRRRVSSLPPSALFTMPAFPLGFEFSTESIRLDLNPTPHCPFCGVLLQRLQPEFLLSTSPV